MRERCDAYDGEETPGQTWWTVMLSASGRADEWPVYHANLTSRPTRAEAEAFIASLPERFRVSTLHAPALVEIERDRLYVTEGGYPSRWSSCRRCGWERSEHETFSSGEVRR
jgi:hypothetical protein